MANYPRPQNRKRKYREEEEEANLFQEDLSPLHSKKFKSSKERDHHRPSASRFPPPEFWDALSKVWLTRRALRELDRRNQLNDSNRPCARVLPTSSKPVRQSLSRQKKS